MMLFLVSTLSLLTGILGSTISHPTNLAAHVVGLQSGDNSSVVIYLRYDVNCSQVQSTVAANIFEVGTTQSCDYDADDTVPTDELFYCNQINSGLMTIYLNGTVVVSAFAISRMSSPNSAQGALVTISIQTQCSTDRVMSNPIQTNLLLAVPSSPPTSVVATMVNVTSIQVAWTPASGDGVVQLGWLVSYTSDRNPVATSLYVSNTGVFHTVVSGLTTGATYAFTVSTVSYINSTATSSNSVKLVATVASKTVIPLNWTALTTNGYNDAGYTINAFDSNGFLFNVSVDVSAILNLYSVQLSAANATNQVNYQLTI